MKNVVILLSVLMLAACSSPAKEQAVNEPVYYAPEMKSSELAADLARQLAPKVRQYKTAQIGVTHLVDVNGQYDQASTLSQVFSENLVHALLGEHLKIVDYKTTDFIRVTQAGDFALSRDYLELDEISPLTHVMVGTISPHKQGYLVNARVVAINGNQVVSSGQVFIPKQVANELRNHHGGALLRN